MGEQSNLKDKIEAGLRDEDSRRGRQKALSVIKPGIVRMGDLEPELRDRLREIKESSLADLSRLLDEAVCSLKDNGCRVLVADSHEEAIQYIKEIVRQGLVVKSKTNAGQEIGISRYLKEQGAEVIETDLGDRINQLAESGASHSLAPAIHIPIERVAELFASETGEKLECNTEVLVGAARKSLRGYLERADVGITGANAIVAETGSILLTENEGNIRAVSGMPPVHIVIAGVEKIVPSLEDALVVARAAAVYGLGQDIGTYVSVISGIGRCGGSTQQEAAGGLGPREVHVVLLRQGREKAIRDGFAPALYCINCGSCLNFCPVYTEIGEKFGSKYLGGRGAVFAAFHDQLQKAEEAGLDLCLGCGKCQEVCPAGINIAEMVMRLRAKVVEEKGLKPNKRLLVSLLTEDDPRRKAESARDFLKTAVSKDRLFPEVAKRTFPESAKGRRPVENPVLRVSFFAGCGVNFLRPQLGLALLDVLAAQNVEVVWHENEACCGMPLLKNGAVQEALALAKRNIALLAKDDCDYLLFVCPACAATVKNEWPLLAAREGTGLAKQAQNLAEKVMDANRFLTEILALKGEWPGGKSKVTYHDPCYLARGLGVREEPRRLLQAIKGLELVEMAEPDSCCGFASSFSFDYYDLSKRIGLRKAEMIERTGADFVATSCPGCMIHLADGLHHLASDKRVFHTIELAAAAVKGGSK